jgi:dTDP-4-amino-4,6-dideoxygalactose transaminase
MRSLRRTSPCRDKRVVSDLAIFGGAALLETPAHVGAPNIGDRRRLAALLDDALDRRWLTNDGPYVQEFERRLGDLQGVRNVVATCNCTVALMLLSRALGLTGEVILPSLTFVATAHALLWEGATPVFCDVDSRTWTLDAQRVEELVGPATSAILGVHLWGQACEVDALQELASRRGLHLLFDAAHALGCAYRGRPVGGFGAGEAFSFHATKVCNAFEGGAITTDDDELAERLRLLRNFGFVGPNRVVSPGINAKLSEAHAAMGLVSLDALPAFVEVNAANMEAYRDGLAGVPGVALRPLERERTSNLHYVVIEVDGELSRLGRDRLEAVLSAENVLARRYFHPGCHAMEPYRSRWPTPGGRLPVTETVLSRVLCLPTGTAVSTEAIEGICRLIGFAVEHGDEIASRLPDAGVSAC